jgi:hypothetical protein
VPTFAAAPSGEAADAADAARFGAGPDGTTVTVRGAAGVVFGRATRRGAFATASSAAGSGGFGWAERRGNGEAVQS